MSILTASIVQEYQQRSAKLKTIGEFKELGRELRDKFSLSDRDAIDLLNNTNIIEILSKYEKQEEYTEPKEPGEPWDGGELWNADPNCEHRIICPPGGGVRCLKCSGWFCY